MAGLHDRARMTVGSAPGTGTITLGSAVTGSQTFLAAGVVNGEIISYGITDYDASGAVIGWEVGRGTYTTSGTTLARTTVLFSSNSNSAISASALAQVYATMLAEDISVIAAGNTAGIATVPLANLTLSAVGGITLSGATGSSSGTLTLSVSSESSLSVFEPTKFGDLGATTFVALPNGATMHMAPMALMQPLVINQIRLLGTFTLQLMTSTSSTKSASASASMSSGISVGIYSAMGAASSNSYTLAASTTVAFSITQTISMSSTNITNGITVTYPSDGTTTTSNLSSSTNVTTFPTNAATSNFSSIRQIDIPFATTLQPGNYIIGIQGGSASAGASALSWSATAIAGMTQMTAMPGVMGATTVEFFPGVGILSTSATSIVPASFDQFSLSSSASMFRPWFHLGNI